LQKRALRVEGPFDLFEQHGRGVQHEAVDAGPVRRFGDARLREPHAAVRKGKAPIDDASVRLRRYAEVDIHGSGRRLETGATVPRFEASRRATFGHEHEPTTDAMVTLRDAR
jgi:hypothetical protein